MIKRGEVLFLLFSTFLLVAAWIGFNIYHTWVTSTISPDLQMAITPIDPNFDTSVLENLKTRDRVTPVFQLSGGSTPSASPTLAPVLSNRGASESSTQVASGP